MSIPSTAKNDDFVCVLKLINRYAAIYQKDNKKLFISSNLEIDIRVAQVTAQSFALSESIPYKKNLYEANPIITILRQGAEWFPAELHSDKALILTSFLGFLKPSGTQENAIELSKAIAQWRGVESYPSIGIALSSEKQS